MAEDKHKVFLKYILFLIYPWVSLFYSMKSLNEKSSYNIFLFFGFFFGLAFIPKVDSGMDSVYYYQYFIENRDLSLGAYLQDFSDYVFGGNSDMKDIYIHTVVFISSIFSNSYRLFFGLLALVFGVFFIKSFRYLTYNSFFNNSTVCYLLALMFVLSNPIFNINGVRFWTGAWISTYLVFKIILDNKKIYLLWFLVVPLIHSSFWIFVILFFGYYLLRSTNLLKKFFYISFFLSSFMLAFVQDISGFLPSSLAHYVAVYTSDSYMEYRGDQVVNLHWYIKLLEMIKNIYPNVLILVFLSVKSLNFRFQNLLRFILILAIFVNLTISIPSVGNRFIMLLYPLLSVFWIYHQKSLRKFKFILYIFPFVFIKDYFVLFQNIRLVLDPYFYFSPTLYYIYHIF